MKSMFEATATDFPFVAEVTSKREKARLVESWDIFDEVTRACKTKGALVPYKVASIVLKISVTRIDELANNERLERINLFGHRFVTEESVRAFATMERKSGRPVKALAQGESVQEAWTKAKRSKK